MKKTGTGLLWSIPEMWEVGKNCHLEKIICPHCGEIETACVLHTNGEPMKSHVCQECRGYIGQSRWQLANIAGNGVASCAEGEQSPPDHGDIASQKMARPDPNEQTRNASGEAAPPAGCWVCAEDRERGEWPPAEGCASCQVEPTPPVQGTLF